LLHISVGCFFQKAMENSHWASLWVQWITPHLWPDTVLQHFWVSLTKCSTLPKAFSLSVSRGSDALGLFPFSSFFYSFVDATMASRDSANSQSCRILDCFPKLSRRCCSRLRCGELSESGWQLLPSRFLTEEMSEKFIELSWCWPCLTNAPAPVTQVRLSFPLGVTVALPFKEEFQLVVVKNVDARRWRHAESISGGGAGTGTVSVAVLELDSK